MPFNCDATPSTGYKNQRAAYAGGYGVKNVKELVKQQLLENWADGDTANDATLDLAGLNKENITLSDVAAALGDFLDQQDAQLPFTYSGSTRLWGADGLVEKLKKDNDCDVRNLDSIDLSFMIAGASSGGGATNGSTGQSTQTPGTTSVNPVTTGLIPQQYREARNQAGDVGVAIYNIFESNPNLT